MDQNDYYGRNNAWFVGIVEQLVDQTYVKARIFGIHPIDKTLVTTDMLPNALITYPVTGGQVGSGSISHNLEVDSWVIGFWADYPFCQQPIITAVIEGTDYSMSSYPSQGGEFVGQGTGDDQTGPNPEPGGPDPENPGITTNIPGNSNVQKAYNYVSAKLAAEGYSGDIHLATSGCLGCLQVESPGIRPEVTGGYRGRAWGICQWLNPRRAQLFRRYGQTKRLDQQLDFMWWELNNTERRAKQMWLRATNLPDSVAGFAAFERADEYDASTGIVRRGHKIYKRRLQEAYKIYNSIKQTGAPQTAAPRPGPV